MSTPNKNDAIKSAAERLKAEGNALHGQGKFQEAYDKYSLAIKEDPDNAVLWSNRAASCLAMKKYLDAASDAKKVTFPVRYRTLVPTHATIKQATKLDPKYSKAWARLGTAYHNLCSWDQSITAWKSALETLPTDRELTNQEKSFKAQFEDGLQKATAALDGPTHPQSTLPGGDVPWARAKAMEEELKANGQPSCAFVLVAAHRNWKLGIDALGDQEVTIINGQEAVAVRPGVLDSLLNAIMYDSRIFHLHRNDFPKLYTRQVLAELKQAHGWFEGGPKTIQEQALKMLEESGWEKLRPALGVTIRVWILREFMHSSFRRVEISWMENAIEMIEWGRETWKDIPLAQRGIVFHDTFLLATRQLYIQSLVKSLGALPPDGSVSDEILDKFYRIADTILKESEKSRETDYAGMEPGGVNFSFWAAFWLHPRGQALATLAWREQNIGNRRRLSKEERVEHYAEAASFYTDAAKCFPKDDIKHLTYKLAGLESLWFSQAKLGVTLPYAREIKLVIPGVRKIWGSYHEMALLEDRIYNAVFFEEMGQKAIDEGGKTLENKGFPEYVVQSLDESA